MVDSNIGSIPAIGGVFQYGLQMRWGDLDALNHLNNTIYFRYLEEARVQLFLRAGIVASQRQGVLVHASCDFLQALHYPAEILVSLILTKVGRTSLAFDTRIERQDQPGNVYAQGHNVLVGTDAATGRPMPWSGRELTRLATVFRTNS
jgi:acyl-CoA thioester hydrolase